MIIQKVLVHLRLVLFVKKFNQIVIFFLIMIIIEKFKF